MADATIVLVCGGTELARWPFPRTGLDLSAVDHLARLQLAARRAGCSIRVSDAGAGLVALLDLAGLASVVQVSRKPEELEQRGVEEVVVPDDLVP